jgi:hypothetical protein
MENLIFSDLIRSALLSVLIFSGISSLVSLCYARSSFSLGSTYVVPPDEVELDYIVAQFIFTQARLRQWEIAENWYGAKTTVLHICQAASGAGDTYAISFHIGHGLYTYYPNGLHFYILDDNGSPTYDYVVHSWTSNRRTRFALIWSCWQAFEIGGFHDETVYGPYGMPHAWLHTTSLNYDGYLVPDGSGYSYIGWYRRAPHLRLEIEGAVRAGYHFLLNFYSQAFHGCTIRQALDYATDAVWGDQGWTTFYQCPFYIGFYLEGYWTCMMVYGDGNLILP